MLLRVPPEAAPTTVLQVWCFKAAGQGGNTCKAQLQSPFTIWAAAGESSGCEHARADAKADSTPALASPLHSTTDASAHHDADCSARTNTSATERADCTNIHPGETAASPRSAALSCSARTETETQTQTAPGAKKRAREWFDSNAEQAGTYGWTQGRRYGRE